MEAARRLGLGFSTCPNDTFMFHALVHGRVPDCALTFDVYMDDIAALNARCLSPDGQEKLDVCKVSAGALPWITTEYTALRSGAAMGRGCGPLVVCPQASPAKSFADLAGKRVAIPGERTTAYLLMRIFGPSTLQPVPMRFDRIMPAVATGEVDAGLIIHESRFTYPDHGLRALADLGELWEGDTGLPLPLGVIAARRSLGEERIAAMDQALSQSVRHAFAHPAESQPYIREHAQEMSPEVCRQHIELYVNDFSADMGEQGKAAIDALLARGQQAGVLPPGSPSPWR